MSSITKLVGIINITPDSFSDGDLAFAPDAAIARAKELLAQGAKVLDVGAESTRPNAIQISSTCETERLKPALKTIIELAHNSGALVSLDTQHAQTAAYGLACGVDWINDVGGATNLELLEVVANSTAKYVLMHSLGVPPDAAKNLPNNDELYPIIANFFKQKIAKLEQLKIPANRIIIDVGLGFGKCAAGNLRLLWEAPKLQAEIGCEMLVGHSRKSMFKAFGANDMRERDQLTLLASSYLASQQIAYLRVHNIAAHQQLLENT